MWVSICYKLQRRAIWIVCSPVSLISPSHYPPVRNWSRFFLQQGQLVYTPRLLFVDMIGVRAKFIKLSSIRWLLMQGLLELCQHLVPSTLTLWCPSNQSHRHGMNFSTHINTKSFNARIYKGRGCDAGVGTSAAEESLSARAWASG